MIQFDFSVNSAIRDIFIQFQLAVGQSHFAVVTVENELFTWAVSMKFSSNSKYLFFFFLLVTSSNRRLFVTQISDFFVSILEWDTRVSIFIESTFCPQTN